MFEALIDFFKDYGYWGMGVVAFLSGSIVPVASEVLLLFFLNLGLDAYGLTAVATLGNTIGGTTCFFMGYLADKKTLRRVFNIPEKRMERADMMIQRYGYWTAALSFVPFIGEAFLIALGVMRVNVSKVIVVMAVGKFLRYLFITASYTGLSGCLGF